MQLSHDEREELRATARALLAHESSPADVRTRTADGPAFDPALWQQMVDLGWVTIHVPEEHGGAGCGYAELGVVLHELGRSLTPSPFLATILALAACLAADEPGDNTARRDQALGSLVEGGIGTVALTSTGGTLEPGRLTARWEHVGETDAIRLTGGASFVLDADVADVLVVAARHVVDDRVALVVLDRDTPGVRVTARPAVDQTRCLFTVELDDVAVGDERLLCEPGPRALEILERVLAVAAVAAACDATGATERVLEVTSEYASQRMQFGKPIGSFQAVKHHCANMAISVETSRAAVRATLDVLDGDPAAWSERAAVAASYVGPACSAACGLGLRVHGGIGFTWEHDIHLFLKRVKLDEVLFGTPAWHRQRLAGSVFPRLLAARAGNDEARTA